MDFRNIVFIIFILCFGCKNKDLVDSEFLVGCENNPSLSRRDFEFSREKLTPININALHHKSRSAYSILNRNDINYILATSPISQSFTIYDVTNAKIIKNSKLDYPPIVIGQTTFKSFDSIYFQVPNPATLFRFDSTGAVLQSSRIENFNTDWELEGSPPGLLYDVPQGRLIFTKKNKFLAAIDPFGLWYYPNKEEIKSIVEYDLSTNLVTSNFSKIASQLSKAPIELIDKYTIPFVLHHKQSIYVAYPYDHSIYLYDDETKELLKKECLASEFISKLASPLKINHSDQENINFQISKAYYSEINYHSKLNIFSRIVFHEKELYQGDGKLNKSICDRTYSLILFDEALNFVSEIYLENFDVWDRALPTPKGFIVPGKCSEFSGEDYFEYNVKYELIENFD